MPEREARWPSSSSAPATPPSPEGGADGDEVRPRATVDRVSDALTLTAVFTPDDAAASAATAHDLARPASTSGSEAARQPSNFAPRPRRNAAGGACYAAGEWRPGRCMLSTSRGR